MISTGSVIAKSDGASSRLIGCIKELGAAGWNMMGMDECCFAVLCGVLVDCVVFPIDVSF